LNVPAILWQPASRGRVTCHLCAHRCTLALGRRGPCFLRHNQRGRLVTDAHAELRVAVASVVERKPLFHFLPGATTWTLGTAGCNLRCAYCQNAALSQPRHPRAPAPPARRAQDPATVVAEARTAGAAVVAFSFSEPSVAYEWVRDVMSASHEAGLRSVWVTNGFFTPELLECLARDGAPDAANVDLKAADHGTWRRVLGGRPEPVLESLSGLRQLGTWVEVTTVLIPGMNDGAAERSQMARWLLERLGEDAPWHLWRFHPDFRLTDRGPLSSQALIRAGGDARTMGLRHVYLGPAGGVPDQVTCCARCGELAIARRGYDVLANRIDRGRCGRCGCEIAGVWA
jgi:pyruvate formate lyase activating enzyme